VFEGVCGASSIVVSFYAGTEVLCGPHVETAVSAREHVDVIHLNNGPSTRSFGHSLGVIDAFVGRHERALCASRI
jgi:hypothetical protein